MKKTKKAVVTEEQPKVEETSKKPKKQKEPKEKEPVVRKQAVFTLSLTKFELLHMRDLMGILLPPDGSQTLSQALASSEDRSLVESRLWEKLSKTCVEAGLPVGDAAPDYIVAPVAPPPMGVFLINQDNVSSSQDAGFIVEEEDEDEDSDEE